MAELEPETPVHRSEPAVDPKVQPAPPANPEVDEDALERGRERLDEVSGN